MKVSIEDFRVWWNELDGKAKIRLFKEYCFEADCDDEFWDFDDEFFQLFSDDPMEICRATCYGEVDFTDEYIRKDVCGNFESLSYFDAIEIADNYADEIYENESVWEKDYNRQFEQL